MLYFNKVKVNLWSFENAAQEYKMAFVGRQEAKSKLLANLHHIFEDMNTLVAAKRKAKTMIKNIDLYFNDVRK